MRKNEWGLVLTGGGGKGAYQIGVWKALREFGLEQKITAVSGVSVGALNAVLFGLGDLAEAEDIWSHMDPGAFLEISLNERESSDGVFSRNGLIKLMDDRISFETVAACNKRIYVAVSNTQNAKVQSEYFTLNGKSEDEIKTLLLASSALPVIYDSVKIGEKVYRDGGLKDNLPVSPLYEAGYRKILVIGLKPQVKLNAFDYPGTEFIPILPSWDLGDFFSGTLDFSKVGSLRRLQLGYQDGKAVLEWYYSNRNKTWSEFQVEYRKEGQETYQRLRQGRRQIKLEGEIREELEKLKDLMKRYSGEQEVDD